MKFKHWFVVVIFNMTLLVLIYHIWMNFCLNYHLTGNPDRIDFDTWNVNVNKYQIPNLFNRVIHLPSFNQNDILNYGKSHITAHHKKNFLIPFLLDIRVWFAKFVHSRGEGTTGPNRSYFHLETSLLVILNHYSLWSALVWSCMTKFREKSIKENKEKLDKHCGESASLIKIIIILY